jgi:hypothetical protein
VYVVNRGAPDRRGEVAAVVADIRAYVNHLDLAMTDDRRSANVVVRLVHKRDFKQTVRSVLGSERAAQIERLLSPQCLSGLAKDQHGRQHTPRAQTPDRQVEHAHFGILFILGEGQQEQAQSVKHFPCACRGALAMGDGAAGRNG